MKIDFTLDHSKSQQIKRNKIIQNMYEKSADLVYLR